MTCVRSICLIKFKQRGRAVDWQRPLFVSSR
ncbi:hypothetical protein NK6_253 [Bradyrhizobium diazoefficiens]|uniref:Uncharacterized protein n=1 Tax=Bradyrhizobium diazoefficiens TaxID=1355477 RepID=A0A0E4FQG1_9BRAD|nr:hypothetical protein NK6_253 [Bradyrhizobium diazoefficiens]